MEKLERLSCFINRVASDVRLRPTHISLYIALCDAWRSRQFSNVFNVSRRRLMCAAHIRSIATYHKVIRDLKALGYLHYWPSYHPAKGSIVSLENDENLKALPLNVNREKINVISKGFSISVTN